MKQLMIVAALCFGTMGAQAQTRPVESAKSAPDAHVAYNCMRATDKDWASLNLTPEQTTQVKAIQRECIQECGAMMKDNPGMGQMMDKHESRVKAVLTPDQYDNWMKWCSAQAGTKEMPSNK